MYDNFSSSKSMTFLQFYLIFDSHYQLFEQFIANVFEFQFDIIKTIL